MPIGIKHGTHHLKRHAHQLAVFVLKALGHVVVDNGYALVLGVFLLPGRGFHFFKTAAHNDLDVGSAQAPRRAAAVHRGIAATQHNDARRDFGDVAERHRCQPVNADVNVRTGLFAPRDIELAPAWRAAADKHRVKALLEQARHGIHTLRTDKIDAQIQHVAGFFINHRLRQPKAWNLGADKAARLGFAVKHGHVVTQRRQVARHGK